MAAKMQRKVGVNTAPVAEFLSEEQQKQIFERELKPQNVNGSKEKDREELERKMQEHNDHYNKLNKTKHTVEPVPKTQPQSHLQHYFQMQPKYNAPPFPGDYAPPPLMQEKQYPQDLNTQQQNHENIPPTRGRDSSNDFEDRINMMCEQEYYSSNDSSETKHLELVNEQLRQQLEDLRKEFDDYKNKVEKTNFVHKTGEEYDVDPVMLLKIPFNELVEHLKNMNRMSTVRQNRDTKSEKNTKNNDDVSFLSNTCTLGKANNTLDPPKRGQHNFAQICDINADITEACAYVPDIVEGDTTRVSCGEVVERRSDRNEHGENDEHSKNVEYSKNIEHSESVEHSKNVEQNENVEHNEQNAIVFASHDLDRLDVYNTRAAEDILENTEINITKNYMNDQRIVQTPLPLIINNDKEIQIHLDYGYDIYKVLKSVNDDLKETSIYLECNDEYVTVKSTDNSKFDMKVIDNSLGLLFGFDIGDYCECKQYVAKHKHKMRNTMLYIFIRALASHAPVCQITDAGELQQLLFNTPKVAKDTPLGIQICSDMYGENDVTKKIAGHYSFSIKFSNEKN